jgi:5-formyltetrahydrofolate cyclo-ligase
MDKQDLRERVWDDLEASGAARFPFPPHGRIPNFAGAGEAADRLAARPAWRDATVVKANPDAPQLPVRRRALREGKTVYMAVPRLRDEDCFLELDPERIDDVDAAATISHVDDYAVRVGPEAVPTVDLVVSGSVAVTDAGARIGKGEGYSDLEFVLLREFGRVDDATPVATTVHERQVLDEAVPVAAHDVALDLVVTPERTIETGRSGSDGRPAGVDWDLLDAERRAEIPVLERLDRP